MTLPNPYAMAGSLLLTAALLGGVWLHGSARGKARQAEADATRINHAEGHRDALRRALNANARTFRAIDATTRANLLLASKRKAAIVEAAVQAAAGKLALERQVAALNKAAAVERSTCSQAEIRICGVPLR